MLTEDTIEKINDEIQDCLREASSSFYSATRRQEALDRADRLTKMLNPQASDQTIDYDQLADAIVRKLKHPEPRGATLIDTLIDTLANRNK